VEVGAANGTGRACRRASQATTGPGAHHQKEAGLGFLRPNSTTPPRISYSGAHCAPRPLWLNPLVKLKVTWIGKTKEAAIQSLTEEYLKRLSRYTEVEGGTVKDEAALLKLCARDAHPSRHTLVLLDGRGKQLSSEELAKFLGDYQDRNPLPLLFAVGAADGFTDKARQAATLVLSLGKMTLAHEVARVVLLEQLYRAFTILKGHPYHLGH
jgi:23S rRNA (pseudouridine1915-N3)-methyltransferase